jgi:putative peptidoglycan lipid II flippase
MAAFKDTVALGVRQIDFLLVPAAAASAVLAEPIVRLVYERGAFEPDQTTVVAQCLAAFSLGLSFNGLMLMLNRSFFSLQAPWVPTVVALVNLALNTALYVALYHVGAWGVPLAISLANVAGAAILFVVLRRRVGLIDFRATARSLVLVTVASAVLAGVAYGVWHVLDDALGRGAVAQIVSLGTALAAGGGAYLVSCRLLGVREFEALLTLRDRFRRG